MTKAYRDAINLGKASAGAKWRDSFARIDRRQGLTELHCRLCGGLIGKLMPVGNQTIRRVKNQTFIQDQVQFCYLPNYREVLMEMSDGSKHVANTCADCAASLDTAKLQALYSMDLSQWSSEGHKLSDSTCNRFPTSVLKVADYIRE